MPTNDYQHTIGKTLHKEESAVPDGAVSSKLFPTGTRFIGPGTMTTRDFRKDRVNVHHDEKNTIVKVDRG
jgi:hypothetical protein